jgi:hypothetical protein
MEEEEEEEKKDIQSSYITRPSFSRSAELPGS